MPRLVGFCTLSRLCEQRVVIFYLSQRSLHFILRHSGMTPQLKIYSKQVNSNVTFVFHCTIITDITYYFYEFLKIGYGGGDY